MDIKESIKRLAKEKNAVILAHYYVDGAIQDIADFVGDSLALAQQTAKTSADIIVMCGVNFMGETCKILCPPEESPHSRSQCHLFSGRELSGQRI